MKKQYFQV